jgi:hypothetical protein
MLVVAKGPNFMMILPIEDCLLLASRESVETPARLFTSVGITAELV